MVIAIVLGCAIGVVCALTSLIVFCVGAVAGYLVREDEANGVHANEDGVFGRVMRLAQVCVEEVLQR